MDSEKIKELLKSGTATDKKRYVMHKLGHIANVSIENIHIERVDRLGWQAIIRTEELDFVFTYYDHNCWKIESFPVYAMSCSTLRSERF